MTKLDWKDCPILTLGKYFLCLLRFTVLKTDFRDSNSPKEVIKSHGHLVAVTRAASPPPAVRRHDRAVAEVEHFNIDGDGGGDEDEEELFNIDDDRGGDEDEEDDSGGGAL